MRLRFSHVASVRTLANAMFGVLLLSLAAQLRAQDDDYFGLLRSRDLTPFGFLRLDMRPTHAVQAEPGAWGIEMELGYQNTWALSEDVERQLTNSTTRRTLGPAELEVLRGLPGENYLIDLELALLDAILHYKLSEHWGTYLIVSGVSYSGGFMDNTIEGFHDTFGYSTFGRNGASQNDVNVFLDLKSVQLAAFEAPTSGGLLDPTVGLRYSGLRPFADWDLVLEAATKVPLGGQRDFLSTGELDVGLQATLQRFAEQQALYASLAAVYYDGTNSITPTPARVIPTLVLGYERRLTPATHVILQGYVSPSIYTDEETELEELTDTKFQLTLGFFHRIGAHVLTFGITENLQNFYNTPDIGFQFGWAYAPGLVNR